MAVPVGVKLDDGAGGFFTNCFPARNAFRQSEDAGAWLVAQKVEQRRHFKAVLCAKPKTYAQLKHERKEREREERRKKHPPTSPDVFAEADSTTAGLLDGFFLLKHCCVEDPSDVCSINVTAKELTDVKAEDFQLFDNVAYINAGENLLPFEAFTHFPIVRELEMPLNALRGIKVEIDDFPNLEVLDLSYNNLSKEDILCLGTLPKLKVLYLTGNQLRSLPVEMAKPYKMELKEDEETSVPRFGSLELLSLDDNHLTDLATFASLAGLPRLRRLHLDKNDISSVPHLRALSGSHVAVGAKDRPASASSTSGRKRSGRRSSASSRKSSRASTAPHREASAEPDVKDSPKPPESTREANEVPLKLTLDDDIPTQELPPPFPELEHLSLAFNKIAEEESLLAVAAWPMLRELVIHDNPLTKNSSGDPPLLRRYLTDRLGVVMVRKKPEAKPKPTIQVPTKPHRKVAEVVPPIPKKPLQLMLESSPTLKALPPSSSSPHRHQPTPPPAVDPAQSGPLPPIPPTPEQRPGTDPLPNRGSRDSRGEGETLTRTKSWTADSFEAKVETPTASATKVEQADEPVFLTQVDDQTEEVDSRPVPPQEMTTHSVRPARPQRVDSAAYSIAVPDKFKGYEIFYDTPSDSEEEPIVKDIQGNLRSLRLALKQQTLYQNQVDLGKLQKPFEPYKQSKFQPRPPHKNKAERLEDILEGMKTRLVTEEANLGKLLEDRRSLKKDYPEVLELLQEIQQKYSSVRASSMHDSERQEAAVADTLKAMQSLSDQLGRSRSSHEGARPKSGSRTRVKAAGSHRGLAKS